MPTLATDKYCTGCMACVDVCSLHALRKVERNYIPYVVVDTDKCVECGRCEKTCPVITLQKPNEAYNMKVYGGWATDKETRVNSASGGAFSGLAKAFFRLHLGKKVAVIGATLDNNHVKHILIESEKEISKLQNSKYIQSDTEGIFRCVKDKIKDNYWILFSGCPCQIAGLYGYLGNNKGYSKLITIGLVCHGIASKEALDLHLKFYNSSKIYRFRDKRFGTQDWKYSQTTTIDRDGNEYRLERCNDVFYSIYSGWLLNRISCSNCIYSQINRIEDITIADFWGLPIPDYYKDGVSLIITNNSKGNSFLLSSNELQFFKAPFKVALNGNPNLYNGYKFIQYHPFVLFPAFFKKVCSDSIRFNILRNKMPYKLFWAIFKILTIYLAKYKKTRLLKRIEQDERYTELLKDVELGGGEIS